MVARCKIGRQRERGDVGRRPLERDRQKRRRRTLDGLGEEEGRLGAEINLLVDVVVAARDRVIASTLRLGRGNNRNQGRGDRGTDKT